MVRTAKHWSKLRVCGASAHGKAKIGSHTCTRIGMDGNKAPPRNEACLATSRAAFQLSFLQHEVSN